MNTSALSSSPSIKPLQPPQQPGAIFNLTIKKKLPQKIYTAKVSSTDMPPDIEIITTGCFMGCRLC